MPSLDVVEGDDFSVFGARLAEVRDAAQDGVDLVSAASAPKCTSALTDIQAFAPVVTIVGQVKAGKTALTNALAQCPGLLPSNVNPWTSAVTALHLNLPKEDERAMFTFMDRDDWEGLREGGGRLGELAQRAGMNDEAERLAQQVDELHAQASSRLGKNFQLLLGQKHSFTHVERELVERYVCLAGEEEGDGDKAGRYADITKSADLYLTPQPNDMPVVLRDTPGVNDPFLVREQVTLRALSDTDKCVLTLNAGQALTMSDVGLLRILFALRPEQVIIFVNRIDELQDPVAQLKEIASRIKETMTKLSLDFTPPILFGSAAWANAAQSGDYAELPEASRAALNTLASARGEPPESAAWSLSGIPALRAELVRGAGDSGGARVLRNAANRILTEVRNEIQAIEHGEPQAADNAPTLSELVDELDGIVQGSSEGLEDEITRHAQAFERTFNAAVTSFIEEETLRLGRFIETGGRGQWSANANRLRETLSKAYHSTMAEHQKNVEAAFSGSAATFATLHTRVARDGKLRMVMLPELEDPASPIAIGASLAVDMKQSWWARWIGRERRGAQARENLKDLVHREAEAVFKQLKTENLDVLAESERVAMKEMLSEQCSVLCELVESKPAKVIDRNSPEHAGNLRAAADRLDNALKTLWQQQTQVTEAAE